MKKLIFALTILMFLSSATADIGAKPSAEFHLEYEADSNLTLEGGEIYECEKDNCSTVYNLTEGEISAEQAETQRRLSASYLGFNCNANVCETINYGRNSPQVLVLNFENKTIQSNIFRQEDFDQEFNVKIRDDELVVEEDKSSFTSGKLPKFGLALSATIIIELILGLFFLAIYGGNKGIEINKRLVATLASASIFTLPIVWFVFPVVMSFTSPLIMKICSEIFAVLAEALIIHKLNAEQITLKAGFYISAVMNSFSFMIGILVGLMIL